MSSNILYESKNIYLDNKKYNIIVYVFFFFNNKGQLIAISRVIYIKTSNNIVDT